MEKLGVRLDGLPLILSYAGNYMMQKQISPRRYLEEYQREVEGRKKLLTHVPRMSSYTVPMAATLEISLRAVNSASSTAVELLGYFSFLYHGDIFYELFKQQNIQSDSVRRCAADQDFFQDQIEILASLSFIRLNEGADAESYPIHPVVQDWFRDRFQADTWAQTMSDTISLISLALPETTFIHDWTLLKILILHADKCSELLKHFQNRTLYCFPFLYRLGYLYIHMDRLNDAKYICIRSLEMCESFTGHKCSVGTKTRKLLAKLYAVEGDFDKAQTYMFQALKDSRGEWEVLDSYIQLSGIFQTRNDFLRADLILRKAVDMLVHKLGIRNLAGEGRVFNWIHFPERENSNGSDWYPWHECFDDSDEISMSPTHGQGLLCKCLKKISIIAVKRGKLNEAEKLIRLTATLAEDVFRLEDGAMFDCLAVLGIVLQRQGRLAESEIVMRKAAKGIQNIVGPTHPAATNTLRLLARVLLMLGKDKEAEELMQQLLKICEENKDKESYSYFECLHSFGLVLQKQDKTHQAEECIRRAFEGLRGSAHFMRSTVTLNLAVIYNIQGKLSEAEVLLKELVSERESISGLPGEDTLLCLASLAAVYQGQNRIEEAEAVYKRAVQGYNQSFDREHPERLCAIIGLSALYLFKKSDIEKARAGIMDVHEICQKSLSPNDPVSKMAAKLFSELQKLEKIRNIGKKLMPISYLALCGDPTSRNDCLTLIISEKVPSILCEVQDPQTEDRYIKFLMRHYHDMFLKLRPWKCVICGTDALQMAHHVSPFISRGIGAAPDFEPFIFDIVIPICEAGSDCEVRTKEYGRCIPKTDISTCLCEG